MSLSVIHTIICDDVRREDNGKEILIGVFNDTLVIDQVPAMMATFAIRFLMKVDNNINDIFGQIDGPDGNPIVKFGGHVEFKNARWNSSIFFKIAPMFIPAHGVYVRSRHNGADERGEPLRQLN
jgi:hypothetical protein